MKSLSTLLCWTTLLVAPTAALAGGLSNDLLLSSAWCTFRYNKTTGSSSGRRVVFSPNGTYAVSSQSESYSSGRGGTAAGQSNASGGGRWRVQGGELFMSEGGQFEHVETVVKRNSNGYPIIVADGAEYSQCR